jgi:hypothetical protein
MADTAISAMTAVVTPATTDVFPIVQGGANFNQTVLQLFTLFFATQATAPIELASYTVATLPSAATAGAGAICFASNAGGNGPCIAVSNGAVWKRCDNTSTTVT